MDLRGFHTPRGGSGTDLFGLAEAARSSADAACLRLLDGFGPGTASSTPASSAAANIEAVAVGYTTRDVGPATGKVLEGGDGHDTLDKAFQGRHPMQPVASEAVEDLGDNGWSIGRPATPNATPPNSDADQVGEASKATPPWGRDGAADDESGQKRDQASADEASSKAEWKGGQDTARRAGRGIEELSAPPQAFGSALNGTEIEAVVPLASAEDLGVEEGSAALSVVRTLDGQERRAEDPGVLGNARAGDAVEIAGADGAVDGLEGAVSVSVSETSAQLRRRPSSDLTSHRPVFSLSGHLISPEVRGGKSGEEAHRIARRAFESKLVGWEEFSRNPKVSRSRTACTACPPPPVGERVLLDRRGREEGGS